MPERICQKTYRLKCIAAGICYSCGKAKVIAPRRRCNSCTRRSTRSTRVYRLRMKRAKLCINCGFHPTDKFVYCTECRAERAEQKRLYRKRLKKNAMYHSGQLLRSKAMGKESIT